VIINRHASGKITEMGVGAEELELASKRKSLDDKAFEFMMDEMDYDMRSFRVFQKNVQAQSSNNAHTKNGWNAKLHSEATKSSRGLPDKICQHCCT
jgi:hypothetical protein